LATFVHLPFTFDTTFGNPRMSKLSMLIPEKLTNNRHMSLAAAFAVAMILLTGTGATAEDTLSISSAPAANGTIDDNRSRFSYQIDPGQTISDEYFVQNTGNVPQGVTIYATDAFNSKNGDFALLDTSSTPTDVGSWVVFEGGVSRVDITLEPGQSRIIGFTLNVPAEATPGDHVGGIVVSAETPGSQVSLDRRIATRLYARVQGDLVPQLAISSVDAAYAGEFFNPFGGTATITTTLSNTGNVSLGANVVAGVNTLFGIPVAEFARNEVPELLPGTTRTYSFEVTGVGAWVYLNPFIKLAGTIDDDAINPGPMPTAERSVSLFVVPWHFLLLLVAAGIITIQLRSRSRTNEQRAQEWVAYAAAQSTQKKES
jgi:hypothetical protein